MNRPDQLVVDIVELRRHTGTSREVRATIHLDDLALGEKSIVDGAVAVDLIVESRAEGVRVAGEVSAVSRSPCRRCNRTVDSPLAVDIDETFEADPTDGETWPIEDERIDLTAMVRESLLLSYPVAPLCGDDCVGPEPERFPTGLPAESEEAPGDERWAALDGLRFDE